MNDIGNSSDTSGKKIFFLCPTPTVQNKVVTDLAQQEYEVYIAKDKDSLGQILKKYQNSVVFLDINEELPEKEWEAWVTEKMNSPQTKEVSFGIVTSNEDEQIKRKYLMSLKVPCGYTVVKVDLEKVLSHIFEVLQVQKAKGRRKYIRATIGKDSNTTVNLPYNGIFFKGKIIDISATGIACVFESDPDIAKNTLIKDIQMRIQGSIMKVEGIVFGSRMVDEKKVYVLIFTHHVDHGIRSKIRKYIQQNLQKKMDVELNSAVDRRYSAYY